MNRRFLLVGVLVVGAVASFSWFNTTPPNPKRDLAFAEPSPAAAMDSTAAVITPTETDRVETSEPAIESETVVDEGTTLSRRLNEIAGQLEVREFRAEADRLLARWMILDAHAALAWLESHRGDVRFDRLIANAAQMYIAAGDWNSAQHLVAQIVESSTREWVNEEVWSTAYERRLVSAEDLKESGLSQEALDAIASGSRRD